MTSAGKLKSHSLEWLFSIVLLLLAGCDDAAVPWTLAGSTMGTTWRVTAVPGEHTSLTQEALQGEFEAVLEAVNASMSTYREDSEVSQFNAAPVGEWFDVSSDFYRVLSSAMAISWQSNGAYDVTVGPLVNLWGFGPGDRTDEPPTAEAIDAVMVQVGQDKLRVDGENYSVLKQAELYLDFSSIAKGFAVDELARTLAGAGFEHYLVEIGGEMRVAGRSPRGDAWRIAIEKPEALPGGIAQAIALENAAVATSGDYRNFFEVDGVRYSHTIDPRTGGPVAHELVSVTVVHPSCMMADAWATALTVLGAEEAGAVAEAAGLAVYFIQREGDGYSESYTDAFAPYLQRTGVAN